MSDLTTVLVAWLAVQTYPVAALTVLDDAITVLTALTVATILVFVLVRLLRPQASQVSSR